MTVMELGILSGFAVDKSSIEELDILKRVEDGTKALNLYFQQVTAILEIYLSNSSDWLLTHCLISQELRCDNRFSI